MFCKKFFLYYQINLIDIYIIITHKINWFLETGCIFQEIFIFFKENY